MAGFQNVGKLGHRDIGAGFHLRHQKRQMGSQLAAPGRTALPGWRNTARRRDSSFTAKLALTS